MGVGEAELRVSELLRRYLVVAYKRSLNYIKLGLGLGGQGLGLCELERGSRGQIGISYWSRANNVVLWSCWRRPVRCLWSWSWSWSTVAATWLAIARVGNGRKGILQLQQNKDMAYVALAL